MEYYGALPSVLLEKLPQHYTSRAEESLHHGEVVNRLAVIHLARPDPSILSHRNESDVSRSSGHAVSGVLAIVLVKGHSAIGSFTMESTSQASNTIVIQLIWDRQANERLYAALVHFRGEGPGRAHKPDKDWETLNSLELFARRGTLTKEGEEAMMAHVKRAVSIRSRAQQFTTRTQMTAQLEARSMMTRSKEAASGLSWPKSFLTTCRKQKSQRRPGVRQPNWMSTRNEILTGSQDLFDLDDQLATGGQVT
ncbi:hypothetical protein LX32DRAFT_682662 [Colletotrichum zoysiae]|uniref:Uncharacterized protein n=1 Tax=Colletotrichum zoysiae TaxID=1216348 RepID=A0AAD9HJ37_9PEZI|nr:hypothetical protein LX32DRAFT_682662 [Colletotrichum zoysiae]